MAKKPSERRRYKRKDIRCYVTLHDGRSDPPIQAASLNVSDGGVLLPVATERVLPKDHAVKITMLVPRSTPNTHMLEEFSIPATVVRLCALEDSSHLAMALKFASPTHLDLDV